MILKIAYIDKKDMPRSRRFKSQGAAQKFVKYPPDGIDKFVNIPEYFKVNSLPISEDEKKI